MFHYRHSSGFTSPLSLPLSILSIIWTPSLYINLMYSVLRLQSEYRIWLTLTTLRALMVLICIWLTPLTPRALTALLWLACSHLVTSLYLHLQPTPKYRTVKIPAKWPSRVSKDTLAFQGFRRLFPCFWGFQNVPALPRFLKVPVLPELWKLYSFRGCLFSHHILSEFTSMPSPIT